MRGDRTALLVCGLLGGVAAAAMPADAQDSPVYRAWALEDAGQWEEAAAVYRAALRTHEGVHAAFGLERALLTLGRGEELAEAISALVRDVPDEPLFGAMYVRTLLGLERAEAARAFARDWVARQPHEPEAYRQLYTTGPLAASDARALWRRVRAGPASDSARVIADELAERVLTSGLWPAAREILEERYANRGDRETAEQLALAAARSGDVARAQAVARAAGLGEESAARAWLALYEGDLASARSLLRRADEADPNAVLALAVLSRTSEARASEFGAGVRYLVRGDTTGAARAFARAAPQLPGAEPLLLAWAARLHLARGDNAAAARLYDAVARNHPGAPEAAEAVLAQGRSLAAAGRRDAAVERFEHLILTYPLSAFVPTARRELDMVRGAVPPE